MIVFQKYIYSYLFDNPRSHVNNRITILLSSLNFLKYFLCAKISEFLEKMYGITTSHLGINISFL